MATTTQPIEAPVKTRVFQHPLSRRNPLVLWHLLSLDAPTVAALWTWFFAATNRIRLPAASVLAMAVAVWMLYAADRLLDTRGASAASGAFPFELEERHFFHRLNSRRFTFGIILAALTLAVLLPLLPQQSIRLYGILGGLLVAYFVLIHLTGSFKVLSKVYRLPKELAVGVFFSAATHIPTISREPTLQPILFPAAILFAVLCSLNCLFIYAWEHPNGSSFAHPATRFALRFLPPIAVTAVFLGVVLVLEPRLPWQLPTSCTVSAALLLLLNRYRARFAPSTLRAAADLCLLTPLLLLPSLR